MKRAAISDHDLHAYLDGQLDEARRACVEAYLAEYPAEALRLRDYRAINTGLHALYDGVLDEPVPEGLWRPPQRPRSSLGWRSVAAALAWLIAGGIGGWLARGPVASAPAMRLVDQAVLAHAVYTPELRHPVEVSAEQRQHLVKWLSKRLDTELRIPNLSEFGYELLGGRLLAAAAGPAAQFMYQNATGGRLTLFVGRNSSRNGSKLTDRAFHFARKNHSNTFYWLDGELGYALTAEIDKRALTDIAQAIYRQLTGSTGFTGSTGSTGSTGFTGFTGFTEFNE